MADRQNAVLQAIDATEANPDDAARAHALSQATNTPPSLVQQDQDEFERRTKETLAANLIRDNPYLRGYINAHPLAASISNDDWGNLSDLSKAMGAVAGSTTLAGRAYGALSATGLAAEKAFEWLGGAHEAGVREATEQAEEARKAAVQAYQVSDPLVPNQFRKDHPEWASAIDMFTNQPLGWVLRKEYEMFGGPMGLLSMTQGSVAGYIHGALRQAGAPESLARELAAVSEAEMAGLTGRAHVGEPAGDLIQRMRQDIVTREGAHALELAKPYLDAGQAPPQGLHPFIDSAIAVMSKLDGEAIERAARQVQATNTYARDKDFQLQHFLSLWPDSHIEIPADAIQKLYGTKLPETDDNILGWVPNIHDQMVSSAITGQPIEIPRNLWLTHADPEVREALKDDARWRPGAMSNKGADAALKAVPDQMVERQTTPQSTGTEGLIDGLHRIAGLETPDQMIERLSPVEQRGLDFRDIRPEGSARRASFPTVNQRGETVSLEGTHHFPLRSILPDLYRGQLEGPARVLSEFFGKQLERLAGDVPISVVTKEVMARDYGSDRALGFYDPAAHRIVLREDIVDGSHPSYFATEVVMHEAAHAISSNAIRKFPPLASYTKKLMNHTQGAIRNIPGGSALVTLHGNAFKNEREFIAEAIANSDFQTLLNGIPLPPELAGGLRLARGSMWDAVKQVVKEMWSNLVGKMPDNSVMDAIFNLNQAFEDINARLTETAARMKPDLMEEEDKELFAAKALGMSQRVYTAMRDLALKRRDERSKALSDLAAREEAERQSKEWKDNEAVVRELVTDHVMHLPDIAADHFLRTGELFGVKYRRTRLNGDYISDKTGLDDEHWNANQGLKPDSIAEALGFQSGEQMLQSLRNLQSARDAEGLTPAAYITRMVDALTDREMQQRYGKLKENILEAAKDHVFGETQYDILHEHTLRFAEQLGLDKVGFTKNDILAMAHLEMAKVRVGRIDSTRAMKSVGDLGRIIEGAEATGDWDTAFKVSQQREIAFQVAKMQQKAEKVVDKFKRRGRQASPRDGLVKSVGIEWSNAIQDIYQRSGVAINRSPEDIAAEYVKTGNGSLREFVETRGLPEIFEPDPDFPVNNRNSLTVAGFLLDPSYRAEEGWKNMSWEEFEAVHNSIDSLYVNGRKAQKVELGGALEDHEELIDNLIATMYDVFKIDDGREPKAVDKANVMKTLWAGLIQMETLWTRLARGDRTNPFMKMNMDIMSGGNQVSALEREFSRKYGGIGEFPEDMNKLVENHLLFEPNERGGDVPDYPRKITTRNLLAILQNVGNWSNFDKLTRGHGIGNPQAVETWRRAGYQMWMNDPVMTWLFKHTTKEDWDRAQKLGDLFEELFSHAESVYYNMGARPGPRIQLRSIETPFGTYKGWYHPIIYDSQRPMFWLYDEETGERRPVSRSRVDNPMDDSGIYAAATPSGYQKTRTGYAAPLLLNFDAIPSRMKQMISDIAMRPVVTEVNKIFGDKRFYTAMEKTYGPQYADLLKPYLKDIAGQRRYIDPLSVTGGRVAEYIYSNLVSTLIGFNPGTVLKHFPTALQNSVTEVGAAPFAREFLNTWLNPLGWKNVGWVLNKSDEVARRSRNFRETLTGAYEDLFPGGVPAPTSGFLGDKWGSRVERFRQKMIKAGATPVAWSDLASVVPMWNVVYKQMMRDGETENAAISAADQAVRRAHGSTATTARPAIMRGGPMMRAVIPFYTFFNDMLQRQYETAWRAKDAVGYLKDGNYQKGREEIGKVTLGVWSYFLFPAIVEQAISPIVFKDDDSYLKRGVEIIGRDIASSWPVIRDFVGYFLSGQDPSFSIYGTGARNMQDFARDVSKGEISLSPEHAGKTIKHTAAAIGTTLGVANAQMGRWGEFAYDYATGKQDPEGPLTAEGLPQWYRALRFGDIKERKK